jgi:hypothetical protein
MARIAPCSDLAWAAQKELAGPSMKSVGLKKDATPDFEK